MKRILIVLILTLVFLTACTGDIGKIENGYTNFRNLKIPQFQKPKVGEEIAVIATSKGIIKMKLLHEVAPIGVEKFKQWVDEGKYTNSVFGHIGKNRNIWAMKEGYTKDMNEEERDKYYADILENMSFGDDYEIETSPDYHNFSGAVGFLVYQSKGEEDKLIGSFYVVANEGLDEETLEIMENMPPNYGFTKDIITAYRKIGGVLDYNGNLTMFGQVFYGMDIVYEISNMIVDENKYPLEEPVTIEKIEILKYDGK
ncbi:MAG: hypothetical protein EWM50_00335 [Gottschalkiaceae bacterium]|nr:MAG: hypothetical protein EWM50_00335 [Gottschalkiaceae bacterium]